MIGGMKTVLLVTADAALHSRLLAVLTDALRFERGVAAHSLLEACQCTNADVALVDLAIPDAANSLNWGHWKICHPNTRLAVLFDAQTQHGLQLACAAGAIGVFPRDVDCELLAERLRDVAHGIRVLPNVEFLANMQAGAPKMLPPPQPVNEVNRLRIDAAQRMASVGDKTITLSPLECKLLNYLAANANRAAPNGELLEIVWQCSSQAGGKAAQVKNCIKRLRQKIEPDPGHPRYLVTVRTGGYRLAFEPVGLDNEAPPKAV
jgi:DNA-binding response OmpR family regulator